MATPLAKMFVGYDTGLMELTEHALKLPRSPSRCAASTVLLGVLYGVEQLVPSRRRSPFLRTLVFQVFAVLVLPMVLDIDGIWYTLVFAEAAALLVSAALLVRNRNQYHYADFCFLICLIGPAHLAAGPF